MVPPPPEERFHANVLNMTNLIKKIIVQANRAGYNDVAPLMIDIASEYIKKNYDKRKIIEKFILLSHPKGSDGKVTTATWDKIRLRDEKFFEKNAFDIFEGLPHGVVDAFKKLYNMTNPKTHQPIVNRDDKNEIIDYFHAFVKIAIRYIHAQRRPYTKVENGKTVYRYHNSDFMKEINIIKYAEDWNLSLDFVQE